VSGLTLAAVLSALHLLGLCLALVSLRGRGLALSGRLDAEGRNQVLRHDNAWGLSAVLLVGTGLARAFGGVEKGGEFYMGSGAFHLKMGLLALVLILEAWPMMTFLRWRLHIARGQDPDTRHARAFLWINHVEGVLVVGMIFVASLMARGLGMLPRGSG
jgi:putative membrane protein